MQIVADLQGTKGDGIMDITFFFLSYVKKREKRKSNYRDGRAAKVGCESGGKKKEERSEKVKKKRRRGGKGRRREGKSVGKPVSFGTKNYSERSSNAN